MEIAKYRQSGKSITDNLFHEVGGHSNEPMRQPLGGRWAAALGI